MSSKRQYQKRNRPVLACYECQRRKQKALPTPFYLKLTWLTLDRSVIEKDRADNALRGMLASSAPTPTIMGESMPVLASLRISCLGEAYRPVGEQASRSSSPSDLFC